VAAEEGVAVFGGRLGGVGADAAGGDAGAIVVGVADRAEGGDLRLIVGGLDPLGIARLGHGDLRRGGVAAVARREDVLAQLLHARQVPPVAQLDRKSTRLNSSHVKISYAVFCLKKKNHST